MIPIAFVALIGAPESRTGQLGAAIGEIRRMIYRRARKLIIRSVNLARRLFRQRATSKSSGLAGRSWEMRARRAYTHKPYKGATSLLLMGRDDFETDEQQLARWDGILQGETTTQVIHGPADHIALMRPPWIDQVGVAINVALRASRRDESAAE